MSVAAVRTIDQRPAPGSMIKPCTAPGFLDTGLHYAARLKVVSSHAARASSGLR